MQAQAELAIRNIPSVEEGNAVVYKGVPFKNLEELQSFLETEEFRSRARFFPWSSAVPPSGSLVILAVAVGLLGGTARLLYDFVHREIPLVELHIWAGPPLGAFSGLLVLVAAYIVPSALTVNFTDLRPATVGCLALLSGFSSFQALGWVEKRVVPRVFSQKRR